MRIRVMTSLLVMCCLMTGLRAAEQPEQSPLDRRFVIGLSPYLDNSVKDGVFREIVRMLVEDLPLGSTLSVYDAFQLKSIAEVHLPDRRVFASPKTRANQFAQAIQNIKLFLAKNHDRPIHTQLTFDAAIRLPQFCAFLAECIPGASNPVSVLLIGSPLYHDAKEPAFSMVDGYYPSDGHLQAPSERSVYGLRPGATNNVRPLTAHWVYFGDPWLNELHKEKITRFWTLFLKARGGRLASLSSDLTTAVQGFCHGTNSSTGPMRWAIDPGETKIEMLRASRQVDLVDWITRETLPGSSELPPRILVGPMKIGIRWKDKLDLDLYAAPRHGAETLFFQHPRSPEGYYYRDHRSSPGREFEFIEFETPVDVRTVEAFVNFYKGSRPGGVRGEARIEFDGRIYSAPFSIPAEEGNRGQSGGAQEAFWTRLPVQEILKITPKG